MPLDRSNFEVSCISERAAKTVSLLERGLTRVTSGYCWYKSYRKTWFRRRPQFCMYGALNYSDNGNCELFDDEHKVAEILLCQFTENCDMFTYGTSPFARRRRVIRAYEHALAVARGNWFFMLDYQKKERLERNVGF